jgi:hypothetical protein
MDMERHGPNPFFQSILSNKISSIIDESQRVCYLNHPFLKGRFREYGIGKILSEIVPINFDIGSGILQDCNGSQSKEIDILIWNKFMIPPLLFGERIGVYPVESCFYTIEVKSKLTNAELEKGIENAKSILALKYLANYSGPIKGHPIRILFAYSTDLKEKSEFERYKEYDPEWKTNPIYNCICIIGKGYFTYAVNLVNKTLNWLWFKPDKEYYEVLGLIAGIVNTLVGQFSPNYGYYLLYPSENTKYGEVIS